MIEALMFLTIFLSIAVIVLVTIHPRETQSFSNDMTSNISKASYWESDTLVKVLTLICSIGLFVLLFTFLVISFR